jgi:2-isopropylmalate synthase
MNPVNKYMQFPSIDLKDRQWPSRRAIHAPIWCSVDLRDGNQSLPVPMTVLQKIEMFKLLVGVGFKEIEVGFPASSPTEYEFVRSLIEGNLIPEDVTIQVLVQAREDLIKQTVESLVGAKKVIIHLYNSTSPAQREIVFRLSQPEIVQLAVNGAAWIKEYSSKLEDTDIVFQYSPESFSATEVDFALKICDAVMDVWQPTFTRKMIINLPETIEVATPNIYADQVEWFCQNLVRRDCAIISVHTHNDRGTGVAATELGMLAGAERVEGTLFGNGERTGNVDIITVAINLFSEGIDPKLDFSNIDAIREVYERCTAMKVPPRHPYSGELVFTAFSGSHQDAIRKGFKTNSQVWPILYLVIDPKDIGRKYGEVIRVNGQSGKGGIAHLLEVDCGLRLPKDMERDFGLIAGKKIDRLGREVKGEDLKRIFFKEYVNRKSPYSFKRFQDIDNSDECFCRVEISRFRSRYILTGKGNGPIDAFVSSLRIANIIDVIVADQSEHSLGQDEKASAIAYIQLRFPNGELVWGAGVDTNIKIASVKAILSALNRAI